MSNGRWGDTEFVCAHCHREIESGAKALRDVWICPECFESFRQVRDAWIEGRKITIQAGISCYA